MDTTAMKSKQQIALFPWVEAVHEKLQGSFGKEKEKLLLEALLEIIESSNSEIKQFVEVKDYSRGESLMTILREYFTYFHLQDFLHDKLNMCMKKAILRILSCSLDLAIFLSHGDSESTFVSNVVSNINLCLKGNMPYLWDVLLNCRLMKKCHAQVCHPVLRFFLNKSWKQPLTAEEYVKYIVLLRLWKVFSPDKTEKCHIVHLAVIMDVRESIIPYLETVCGNNALKIDASSSKENIARLLICQKYPQGLFKDIKKALCEGLPDDEIAFSQKETLLYDGQKTETDVNELSGYDIFPATMPGIEVMKDGDEKSDVDLFYFDTSNANLSGETSKESSRKRKKMKKNSSLVDADKLMEESSTDSQITSPKKIKDDRKNKVNKKSCNSGTSISILGDDMCEMSVDEICNASETKSIESCLNGVRKSFSDETLKEKNNQSGGDFDHHSHIPVEEQVQQNSTILSATILNPSTSPKSLKITKQISDKYDSCSVENIIGNKVFVLPGAAVDLISHSEESVMDGINDIRGNTSDNMLHADVEMPTEECPKTNHVSTLTPSEMEVDDSQSISKASESSEDDSKGLLENQPLSKHSVLYPSIKADCDTISLQEDGAIGPEDELMPQSNEDNGNDSDFSHNSESNSSEESSTVNNLDLSERTSPKTLLKHEHHESDPECKPVLNKKSPIKRRDEFISPICVEGKPFSPMKKLPPFEGTEALSVTNQCNPVTSISNSDQIVGNLVTRTEASSKEVKQNISNVSEPSTNLNEISPIKAVINSAESSQTDTSLDVKKLSPQIKEKFSEEASMETTVSSSISFSSPSKSSDVTYLSSRVKQLKLELSPKSIPALRRSPRKKKPEENQASSGGILSSKQDNVPIELKNAGKPRNIFSAMNEDNVSELKSTNMEEKAQQNKKRILKSNVQSKITDFLNEDLEQSTKKTESPKKARGYNLRLR